MKVLQKLLGRFGRAFYLCNFRNIRLMAELNAEPKKPAFGNRHLTDPQNVFEHNAWDNVVWDEVQENEAKKKTEEQLANPASAQEREKYLNEASSYWDEFYQAHENKFFKDRQWLFTEFSELAPEFYLTEEELSKLNGLKLNNETRTQNDGDKTEETGNNTKLEEKNHESLNENDSVEVAANNERVLSDSISNKTSVPSDLDSNLSNEVCDNLRVSSDDSQIREKDIRNEESFPGGSKTYRIFEVGCGAGNTVFPILQTNNDPNLMVYCCDFSSVAVDIVKENKDYDSNRCHAFVCDVSNPEATIPVPDGSLDVIVMIFVFSAIPPDRMQFTLDRLAKLLKPGGIILLRDYGRYDMAQLRFKKGRCLSENFYARGHGTLVYFFTQDELRDMMTKAGLLEKQNYVDRRLQVNRGRQLKMYRVWIQCKYVKPKDEESNENLALP